MRPTRFNAALIALALATGCVAENDPAADGSGGEAAPGQGGAAGGAVDGAGGMSEAGGAMAEAGAMADGGSMADGGATADGGGLGEGGEPGMGGAPEAPEPPPAYLGGDRPANYYLPRSYDPAEPMPLILSLHGYSSSGVGQDAYFRLSEVTLEQGVFLIVAEGRRNARGDRFWAATDYCCDFDGAGDDDLPYLRGLIEEAMTHFPIDPERVGVIGHSNGGFMAYRLACEASDLVTGIAGLAGASWADPARCGEPEPVSVLHVHGTWDDSIRYAGRAATVGDPDVVWEIDGCRRAACPDTVLACEQNLGCSTMWACMTACGWESAAADCRSICYLQQEVISRVLWTDDQRCSLGAGCYDDPADPSAGYTGAEEIVERWRARDGCAEEGEAGDPLDFVRALPGVDTVPTEWAECDRGTNATLWRISRGGHAPRFWPAFGASLVQWLLDHPRAVVP